MAESHTVVVNVKDGNIIRTQLSIEIAGLLEQFEMLQNLICVLDDCFDNELL